MKKIGLFYGSKGGNTESAAKRIYAKFNPDTIDMKCISDTNVSDLLKYDYLIFGVSTVGAETWDAAHPTNTWDSLFLDLKKNRLDGKLFAIFGLGNQIQWPDHFIDDVSVVHQYLVNSGAKACGKWPTEGYEFKHSKSVEGDHFLGLALDEDFQDEHTDERIDKWVDQVKKEFGI